LDRIELKLAEIAAHVGADDDRPFEPARTGKPETVSDREKVGDNGAAANEDLRPGGIADLKSLVFQLKERRPFGVCRSDDGHHEPGSAHRVLGLDQAGTSVQCFGGKLRRLPIVGQAKAEGKPADEAALPRDHVACTFPVLDRAFVIVPKELPLSLVTFKPERWGTGAPRDDLFELARRKGHSASVVNLDRTSVAL